MLVRSCKAPYWCACDDCIFWGRHRCRRRRLFATWSGDRRPFGRRAWSALREGWRNWNPIALLGRVEDSGWGYSCEHYQVTPEVRVARMVLRRWDTLVVVCRALFGTWNCDDDWDGPFPWWVRTLYRLKATLCIVLGWQPKGIVERCRCVGFTFWGLREYGTMDGPGGEFEELRVGYGWGNWFAYVEHESWP